MVLRNKLYLCALCCFLAALSAFAQDLTSPQEDLAQKIFGSVLSPYCPGRLLSDCPSSAASDLKQKIRTQISQGTSEQAIIADLYDQYGEAKLRSTPKAEGFGLVGWVVPGIFSLLGLLILLRWFSSSSADMAEVKSAELDIDPELAKRIERDLNS